MINYCLVFRFIHHQIFAIYIYHHIIIVIITITIIIIFFIFIFKLFNLNLNFTVNQKVFNQKQSNPMIISYYFQRLNFMPYFITISKYQSFYFWMRKELTISKLSNLSNLNYQLCLLLFHDFPASASKGFTHVKLCINT